MLGAGSIGPPPPVHMRCQTEGSTSPASPPLPRRPTCRRGIRERPAGGGHPQSHALEVRPSAPGHMPDLQVKGRGGGGVIKRSTHARPLGGISVSGGSQDVTAISSVV